MPQVGDPGPTPGVLFGEPPVDVGELWQPTSEYVVVALAQNQRYPPDGRTIPDIDVSFRLPGLPGLFVRRIDNYAFTHANVLDYMLERAAQLRAIYALPGEPPEATPVAPELVV